MLKDSLDNFAFNFIDDAQLILRQNKKNASKKLSNSLDYTLKISKNSFELKILAEDYAKFVDRGVKGVGGVKADGSKWELKRVVNSPFKYKNKKPPIKVFSNWIVKKGIAPRNKKGQFTSRKGLQFAIANSVFHTGLETTNFLTTPFRRHFKKLPDEVLNAFGLKVDKFLKNSLK